MLRNYKIAAIGHLVVLCTTFVALANGAQLLSSHLAFKSAVIDGRSAKGYLVVPLPINPRSLTLAARSGNYNIRLAGFTAWQIRSRSTDTVYAVMRLYKDGVSLGDHIWMPGGRDVRGGGNSYVTSNPGDSMGYTVAVSDNDILEWDFVVLNRGSDPNGEMYKQAADAIASQTCKDVWSCVGSAGGAIFVNWAFTNCDGLLAADKIGVAGSTILDNTASPPQELHWSQRYAGTNSPGGCGANSDYSINVVAKRV